MVLSIDDDLNHDPIALIPLSCEVPVHGIILHHGLFIGRLINELSIYAELPTAPNFNIVLGQAVDTADVNGHAILINEFQLGRLKD